jgi:hemerythrin-like domain-containing protein
MCSDCGCRNIPLIDSLTRQHEDILNHSDVLRIALRNMDHHAAAAGARAMSDALQPHTSLEEHGLFAEMRKDRMFTEHIDSLCSEHEAIDAELDAVVSGDLSRIGPLLTLLNNHILREENGLFPAALAFLDDEQWDRLHELEPVDGLAADHAAMHSHGAIHHQRA